MAINLDRHHRQSYNTDQAPRQQRKQQKAPLTKRTSSNLRQIRGQHTRPRDPVHLPRPRLHPRFPPGRLSTPRGWPNPMGTTDLAARPPPYHARITHHPPHPLLGLRPTPTHLAHDNNSPTFPDGTHRRNMGKTPIHREHPTGPE